jgi:hypothetical protein
MACLICQLRCRHYAAADADNRGCKISSESQKIARRHGVVIHTGLMARSAPGILTHPESLTEKAVSIFRLF